MKYPELVPACVCTTLISLTIESENLTEDGAPSEITVSGLMCNWQDGGKAVFTPEQKVIDITGRAFFNGDVIPSISNITAGTAQIFGETREIAQGFKRRNPDGSVNYTEIHFK